MNLPTTQPNSVSSKALALLLLFYFSLMCVGLGSVRALTKHEVFTAQPARELLAGGTNPAIQTFGGVPRYQKPPAMTWMIAAGFSLLGEREWVARMPAVLAGGILVLLITLWSAKHFGAEVAILSGLMQATFYYVLMQARLAEIDMVLATVVALGMCCIEEQSPTHQTPHQPSTAPLWMRRAWALRPWLFPFLAGLSMALKGPVGPAIMYAGALSYAALMRSKPIAWRILHPGKILLFLAVASLWPLWAAITEPRILDFWRNELRGRVKDGLQNPEPFWFYLWNVPMLLAPWILLAIPACLRWRREENWRDRRALLLFVAGWFGAGFLLLSSVADKHKHYCIPILPPLTPFLAYGLVAWLRHQHAQPVRWYRPVQLLWATSFAAAITAVMFTVKDHPLNLAAVIASLGIGGLIVLELERLRKYTAQLAAIFTTAWFSMATVNLLVTPVFDNYGAYAHLGRQMAKLIPQGQKVWILDLGMGQIAYYLPLPLGRVDSIEKGIKPHEMTYAVIPNSSIKKLEKIWAYKTLPLLQGGKPGHRPKPEDQLTLIQVVADEPKKETIEQK